MPLIDVARARALTPGCEQVLHLNHAGASLLPQPVVDAVVDHVQLEAAMGGYEAAAAAEPALEHVYDAAASLIGAARDDIALVESNTTGWIRIVQAFPLKAGDQICISRAEYASNAMALLALRERTACELVLIEDDPDGQIDLTRLEQVLAGGRVAFVSLVHVPTGSGLVNPAGEVGRLCRAAGVPLVLDACQSAGQLAVDVDTLGCDVLTAAGRKFLRGPRGTAFVYVRPSLLERLRPLSVDLHGGSWSAPEVVVMREDARRFEGFEASIAGRIGLGVAIDHALGWGLDAIAERNRALADGLRARLDALRGVTVRDKGRVRCAIVTFTVDGVAATDVASQLRAQGVNVSVTTLPFAQLDLPQRGLDAVVRASVHYITTDEELDRFALLVEALAR